MKGKISIRVRGEYVNEEINNNANLIDNNDNLYRLEFEVEDTGIGIK